MNNKTEFLFESDAEKAILREAAKQKKPKLSKKLFFNSFIASMFFLVISITLYSYKNNEISKIKASAYKPDTLITERLIGNYNDLKKYNANGKYELIINNKNVITEDYLSNYQIVKVQNNKVKNITLEEETYEHYLKLKKNLLQRGYNIDITKGFVSQKKTSNNYNKISKNFGSEFTEKYIPKFGESEHNLGIAFDFSLNNKYDSNISNINSSEYLYLKNIIHLYGFILRYEKEKESITGYVYEPFHLRYVGESTAKYLKKNNITLEERY